MFQDICKRASGVETKRSAGMMMGMDWGMGDGGYCSMGRDESGDLFGLVGEWVVVIAAKERRGGGGGRGGYCRYLQIQ